MSSKIPKEFVPWIEAKKKFRLSQKHIQMARELQMNPKGFGKLANHKQQRWKLPLPQFIEELYFKRFKKESPDVVLSFEQLSKNIEKKKAEKRAKMLAARAAKSEVASNNEMDIAFIKIGDVSNRAKQKNQEAA